MMIYKFFDKKTGSGMQMNIYLKNHINQLLKNSKKQKVSARFKDNIWAADLAEMGSLSSKNKNVEYLLCTKDVFTKYA